MWANGRPHRMRQALPINENIMQHPVFYRLRKDPALGEFSGSVAKVMSTPNGKVYFNTDPLGMQGYKSLPDSCLDGASLLTKSRCKEYSDTYKIWWLVGAYGRYMHRTDGPAIIRDDGSCSWFINDESIRSDSLYQELTGMSDDDMLIMILKYGHVS